jgi:hypothetical protein
MVPPPLSQVPQLDRAGARSRAPLHAAAPPAEWAVQVHYCAQLDCYGYELVGPQPPAPRVWVPTAHHRPLLSAPARKQLVQDPTRRARGVCRVLAATWPKSALPLWARAYLRVCDLVAALAQAEEGSR